VVGDDDARRLVEDLSGVEIVRNTYFVTCPFCGSNNDPGERCDCEGTEKYRKRLYMGQWFPGHGETLKNSLKKRREVKRNDSD